ncbi:MAG TPA: sensor domain-containing diguanylate cyclase [Mycobacteriales bacterium]|nr:sensor domain-containing diguanylate cyclase [Mycobacteriales bacterium]
MLRAPLRSEEKVFGLRRLSAARWWARFLVAFFSLLLVAGAGFALHTSQSNARQGLAQRWSARADLSAHFASTYISQLTAREKLVASRNLAGPDPSAAFNAVVQGFGFPAAVLLDEHGRDLAVYPTDPAVVGSQVGAKYAHLSAALRGKVGVSNIVPSAVTGVPVVAFAVPYQTPQGRRVFSGGYPITSTPLAAYLNAATTLKGARLFLLDGDGGVLATNGTAAPDGRTLGQQSAELGQAASRSLSGNYRSGDVSYTFAKAAVPGTSWYLVITAPTSGVFASARGSGWWVPWLILGLLSVLVAIAAFLAIRLLEGRRRLADANHQLTAITRTDGLTGLSNRRHLTEQLEVLLANASRHDFAVSVLMIDVDHFKALNDTHGHNAGDRALRQIADRLVASAREGDLLARWGGEEFLAVLPFTNVADGIKAAERLCRVIAIEPIDIGLGREPASVSISIGVAQATDDTLDALVHRADLGLYEAKAAGRNTARTASAVAPLVRLPR